MILTHVRIENWNDKPYHSKINLKENTLSIFENSGPVSINLEVQKIHEKYGNQDLIVLLTQNYNEEKICLNVLTPSSKDQIKKINRSNLEIFLYAEIPQNSESWLSPGVRIITTELAPGSEVEGSIFLDRPNNHVQIFHNEDLDLEDENQRNQLINYFLKGLNPFGAYFMFTGNIEIYEKKIG
jgi:hypothetical protein